MLGKIIRAIYRSVFFSAHLLVALLVCIVMPAIYNRRWFQDDNGKKIIQWWHKRATNILGLNITQQGTNSNITCLMVANHISFLDIMVIASLSPVTFLAKSTLRYWPMVGFITRHVGTIFIRRKNMRAAYTVISSLTKALSKEQSIAIFPEGTTTIGETVNKFHTSLFQSALNARKPIQPVALGYQKNGKLDKMVTYINNDIFIFSLLKIMAQPKTNVKITFCDLIHSENMSRANLALISHKLINKAIAASQKKNT